MNWLEALDSIDAKESVKVVIKAMDSLQLKGKPLTYDNISRACEKKFTAYQVEGLMRRFRYRYSDEEKFVVRAKIIGRHFGKNGERKLLG